MLTGQNSKECTIQLNLPEISPVIYCNYMCINDLGDISLTQGSSTQLEHELKILSECVERGYGVNAITGNVFSVPCEIYICTRVSRKCSSKDTIFRREWEQAKTKHYAFKDMHKLFPRIPYYHRQSDSTNLDGNQTLAQHPGFLTKGDYALPII